MTYIDTSDTGQGAN